MADIRKEINIINRPLSGVGAYEERISFLTTDFDGATYYFEVVAQNTSPSDAYIYLKNSNGDTEATITVSAYTNSLVRLRSSSFSPNDTYPQKYVELSSNSIDACQVARVIVLQSSFTKTQTQVEVGWYQYWSGTDYGSPSLLYRTKKFLYKSANWNGTVAVKFVATLFNEDSKYTFYTRLYDVTGDAPVSGSEMSTTADGAAAFLESGSITLVDGHEYIMQVRTDSTKADNYVYNGKIIITQTGTVTKTESHYLLINYGQTTTGLHDYDILWDPDEWSGVTFSGVYHEAGGDADGDAAQLEKDPNGTPTYISQSLVTLSGGELKKRSGNIVTYMPATSETIDTNVTNVPIYYSRIVVEVSVDTGQTYNEGFTMAAEGAVAKSVAATVNPSSLFQAYAAMVKDKNLVVSKTISLVTEGRLDPTPPFERDLFADLRTGSFWKWAAGSSGTHREVVFESNFETGDLSEWDSYAEAGGCSLSASLEKARRGTRSLKMVLATTSTGDTGVDENDVISDTQRNYFEFEINFDALQMASGDEITLFNSWKDDWTACVTIRLYYDGSDYYLFGAVIGSGGPHWIAGYQATGWNCNAIIDGNWHRIRIFYDAGTGSDGSAWTIVDSTLIGSLSDLDDTSGYPVGRFGVGGWGKDAGTTGIIYYDEFKYSRGYHEIYAGQGAVYGAFFTPTWIYQPNVIGDFDVWTKLVFNPTANVQQAGICVRVDDNNHVTLKRYYNTAQYLSNIHTVSQSSDDTTIGQSATTIYLRVKRVGSTFSCYYATSLPTGEEDWTQISNPSGALSSSANVDIGIFAVTESGAQLYAYFDWVDNWPSAGAVYNNYLSLQANAAHSPSSVGAFNPASLFQASAGLQNVKILEILKAMPLAAQASSVKSGILIAEGSVSLSAQAKVSYAAAYYVDKTLGSDDGLGTINDPWETINKVNSTTFGPGDSINFKCGEMWREQLNFPSSGSVGLPITIEAYGSGLSPTITGANLIESSWSETGGETDVWQTPLTTDPRDIVIFDGVHGNRKASAAACTSQRDWYWASNVLYTYGTQDPSITYAEIESGNRNAAIYINGKSYLSLFDLELQGARYHNLWVSASAANISGIMVDGIESDLASDYGIYTDGSNTFSTSIFQNVALHHNGLGGVSVHGYVDGLTIRLNDVYSNVWRYDILNSAGIHAYGSNVNGLLVEENNSYNNGEDLPNFKNPSTGYNTGSGIYIDTGGSSGGVKRNRSYNNNRHGIVIENCDDENIWHNLSYLNGAKGIDVWGQSHNNIFYNNTLFGNDVGFLIGAASGTGDGITGNILRNNIIVFNMTRALSAIYGGENDGTNGSGNIYEYNCLGAESPDFIEWGDGSYKSTYDDWETAYGGSTYSVESNPLLVDPNNGDLRIQAGSPCKNAGLNSIWNGIPNIKDYYGNDVTDEFGNIVAYGDVVDIGAHEYSGNTYENSLAFLAEAVALCESELAYELALTILAEAQILTGSNLIADAGISLATDAGLSDIPTANMQAAASLPSEVDQAHSATIVLEKLMSLDANASIAAAATITAQVVVSILAYAAQQQDRTVVVDKLLTLIANIEQQHSSLLETDRVLTLPTTTAQTMLSILSLTKELVLSCSSAQLHNAVAVISKAITLSSVSSKLMDAVFSIEKTLLLSALAGETYEGTLTAITKFITFPSSSLMDMLANMTADVDVTMAAEATQQEVVSVLTSLSALFSASAGKTFIGGGEFTEGISLQVQSVMTFNGVTSYVLGFSFGANCTLSLAAIQTLQGSFVLATSSEAAVSVVADLTGICTVGSIADFLRQMWYGTAYDHALTVQSLASLSPDAAAVFGAGVSADASSAISASAVLILDKDAIFSSIADILNSYGLVFDLGVTQASQAATNFGKVIVFDKSFDMNSLSSFLLNSTVVVDTSLGLDAFALITPIGLLILNTAYSIDAVAGLTTAVERLIEANVSFASFGSFTYDKQLAILKAVQLASSIQHSNASVLDGIASAQLDSGADISVSAIGTMGLYLPLAAVATMDVSSIVIALRILEAVITFLADTKVTSFIASSKELSFISNVD